MRAVLTRGSPHCRVGAHFGVVTAWLSDWGAGLPVHGLAEPALQAADQALF